MPDVAKSTLSETLSHCEMPLSPVPYGERATFFPTQAFYNDDGTVTYVHHGSQGPTWSETKPQPTKPGPID